MRQFYPKKTELGSMIHHAVAKVTMRLNNRWRNYLDYRNPHDYPFMRETDGICCSADMSSS